MKATAEEEALTRWIDGELSDDDAARFASRPGWAEEKESALALGQALRASIPAERELPHADFFQHQLRRRLEGGVFSTEEVEADSPRRSGTRSSEAPQAFPLFARLRWLSALGFAACLGGIALLAWNGTRDAGDRSEVVHAYAPDPEVVVSTAYDSDAGATVIRLTGVRPLPADRLLFPFAPGEEPGRRLLYSLESRDMGGPVSVYSRGSGDEMPGAVLVGF